LSGFNLTSAGADVAVTSFTTFACGFYIGGYGWSIQSVLQMHDPHINVNKLK